MKETQHGARRAGMLILAFILVMTGSYVRVRSGEEGSSVDWLVILELAMASVGGGLGILLIRKYAWNGFAAKAAGVYLIAVITAALFSSYFPLVAGYWVLLAGTTLLCMGLISSSRTEDALHSVEKLILFTFAFMLLKDSIIDTFLFLPQTDLEERGIEMYRFGMGSTSPNGMALIAVIAFWMSFSGSYEGNSARFWRFLMRASFVTILLLTRTRFALAALLGAAVIRWWFLRRHSQGIRLHVLLVSISCLLVSVLALVGLSLVWRVPVITDVVDLVNRGEDSAEIMSVTGRTDIWPYAIQRIFEGPLSLLFGHGYGASQWVLNEHNRAASFFAYHSHNTFLEATLSTGLWGALPFVVLIVYSLKWFVRFSEVSQMFSLGFTLRAITVISAILSSTMTESEMAIKLGPIVIVFMFYLLSLDCAPRFMRAAQLQKERDISYARQPVRPC